MSHEYYMSLALIEAQKAYDKNEVPIGAIIVKNGEVISSAFNERESTNQATSHAELTAIQRANEALGSWRLDTCTLYVTIEPCPMCAGAIIQSRIETVVYGAKDSKAGVHNSVINLFDIPFNHKVNVLSGVMEEQASKLMKDFFSKLRKNKKN